MASENKQHSPEVLRFIDEIRSEFPRFRIVPKASSKLSKCIDVALKAITFGGQNRFITEYHTVIGETLYVPDSWQTMNAANCIILLRHERVHLRQKRRLTFPLMAFIYLLPWFPLGLAYGRARLEWEAYQETLRATAELLGLDAARSEALRERIISRFTGADYGWMWPFRQRVEAWYDAALRAIETDYRPTNRKPHRLPHS